MANRNRKLGPTLGLGVVAAALSVFAGAGCGVDVSGTYTGTETTTYQNGPTLQRRLTLSLSQKGEEVSGTWYSDEGSGDLTGRVEGERIKDVNLYLTSNDVPAEVLPPRNTNTYSSGGGYGSGSRQGQGANSQQQQAGPTACAATYLGNMKFNDGKITGKVTTANETRFCGISLRSITVTRD